MYPMFGLFNEFVAYMFDLSSFHIHSLESAVACVSKTIFYLLEKVSKDAKIRNRYNQVPHLTQDTNGKVESNAKCSRFGGGYFINFRLYI